MTAKIRILERPSPNYGPRDGCAIDMLILHYTGMLTADDALRRMCDSATEVSAHYMVDEDGSIFRLVEETRCAWHAGRGGWAGETDINSRSIGIEIVNPGHEFGYKVFPEQQMASVELLCLDILARHPISSSRVLGHSDVAPDRKEDPGELFDWARLASAGVGLWLEITEPPQGWETGSLMDLQAELKRFGYSVDISGVMDASTRAAILAFQRHWLPENMTGARDPATSWRLSCLTRALAGV